MRPTRALCAFLLACACVTSNAAPAAAKDEWRPIEPSRLAQAAPVVEKDADAEAIFWEVRINDDVVGSTPRVNYSNYIRIKVFTDRGVESQSKIDIPYIDGSSVEDIAARTIEPDGSIVELTPDQVLDRTIVKASGVKIKAKSFALPGVTPGALIEYRWREVRRNQITFYDRLPFSREIPIQHLPGIEDEPASPPVTNLAPRLAVSYFTETGQRPEFGPTFGDWGTVSAWLTTLHDTQIAPSEALAAKVKELAAGAPSELDEIRAIGAFVQTVTYISIQTGLNRGEATSNAVQIRPVETRGARSSAA